MPLLWQGHGHGWCGRGQETCPALRVLSVAGDIWSWLRQPTGQPGSGGLGVLGLIGTAQGTEEG